MKGLNIPDGTTVYIPAVRVKDNEDDEYGVRFNFSDVIYRKDDEFLTEEELKAKFNEGLPKQGELEFGDEVSVSLDGDIWYPKNDDCIRFTFVSKVKDKYLVCKKEKDVVDKFEKELFVDGIRFYKYCRKYTKTELTLEQVEEKLGMEKGSLIITK